MYDNIECLALGVYRERSEDEAYPSPKTNALCPFFFMLPRFFELCVHKGVCILFCCDAPLFLNPLVMVVAEVDRDVGEPPTSQSITNALILYKTSFKVYLSEVPC